MKRMNRWILTVVLCGIAMAGMAGEQQLPMWLSATRQAFKGLDSWSYKYPYSKSIPMVCLGYDENGVVQRGVAFRWFKSYEKVSAMLIVRSEDGAFVAEKMDIPDIGKIKDPKKQKSVMDALVDISGTQVRNTEGKALKVDAVTGATRYLRRIYSYCSLMAENVTEEMANSPDWPRQKIEP
jgi:hypothetical protein